MKSSNILVRIIFVALVCVSGFMLLRSPVTINEPNVHGMAKTALKKAVDEKGNTSVKDSLQLAQSFGLIDKVIDQLPQKYHYDLSYISLYKLSASYQENGEITAENLNLPEKNEIQKAVNSGMTAKINESLDQNSDQLKQGISLFHYFCLGILIVLILAAVLGLFGKSWAAGALLLAAVASFGMLQYFANSFVRGLQTELDKSITLATSSSLWLGLALGVLTSVGWIIYTRLNKKEVVKE
ncbi:hypothetical protein [Lactobacillus xylocopicola]|uniref:Integral membrane protein n=1 Tax=Lactobacillus xylocopicola TaxID=2976676 RepID=A0ABM8BGA1_9LACO|nr:hypothetical protein [Lactobacillus xylocopicola]BDR60287.1 hypothetical protein KIM322_05480 [Lactobacillus xylocopicola]